MTTDWANEPAPGLAAPSAGMAAAPAEGAGFTVSDDWAKQTAAPAADPSNQWGGSSNWN